MKARSRRVLPVVSPIRGEGSPASDAAPFPDRVEEGWTFRFVADETRAREMVELYRSLGFEAITDPVGSDAIGSEGEECVACQAFASGRYVAVYTRPAQKTGLGHEDDDVRTGDDMSAPDTTAVLRKEHQWILKVASALEELFKARPGPLDLDTVDKCVRFFRLFADACHHGKEEDLLFPELESRGMPRESGPIAVMLEEHRLGRELVATMAGSLGAARVGDEAATTRLVRAGRGYIDLIRQHIAKEDHVLFNMADQMVDPAACSRLCDAYERVCAGTFEGCTKAQLEGLANEILTAI